MKKPNHSNDNSGQNYDPGTGKYTKDSDAKSKPADPGGDPFDDLPGDGKTGVLPESPKKPDEPEEEEDAFEGGEPDWDDFFSQMALPPKEVLKQLEEDKKNKELVAKGEASMGTKQESALKLYGELYDLDPRMVAKASDEEIDKLISAIHLKESADGQGKKIAELSNKAQGLFDSIKHPTAGIWKSFPFGITPEDFPKVEHSLQAKMDWLTENKGSVGALEASQLQGLPQKVAEYNSVKAELDAIGEQADTWSKTIGGFQSKTAMYSQARKDSAVWCKSIDESHKEFGAWEGKCFAKMTKEEAEAVEAYTGSGYSSINKPLNSALHKSAYGYGKDYLVSHIFNRMKLMTSAIDKCKSEKDAWVQRGVDSNMMFGGMMIGDLLADPEKAVGQSFVNHAFMSCGAAKSTGFSDKPIILNIYCPKGTSMVYVGKSHSSYKHENEMIINRGYAFVIKKVAKKGGVAYVDVDLQAGTNHYRMSDEKALEKYKSNLE